MENAELSEITAGELELWRQEALYGVAPVREAKRIMSLIAEVKRLNKQRDRALLEFAHYRNQVDRLQQEAQAEDNE